MRRRLLLPEPEGPRTQTISPRRTEKLTLSTAGTPRPNEWLTSTTSSWRMMLRSSSMMPSAKRQRRYWPSPREMTAPSASGVFSFSRTEMRSTVRGRGDLRTSSSPVLASGSKRMLRRSSERREGERRISPLRRRAGLLETRYSARPGWRSKRPPISRARRRSSAKEMPVPSGKVMRSVREAVSCWLGRRRRPETRRSARRRAVTSTERPKAMRRTLLRERSRSRNGLPEELRPRKREVEETPFLALR